MALESKQYADLIRHREFNALRRIMVQRNPSERLNPVKETMVQSSHFESTQAIAKINALEVQMNQHFLELGTQGSFQATQIIPIAPPESEQSTRTSNESNEITVTQEAGQHFAHNRISQAQYCLEQAVGAQGKQSDHVPTWLTLLDFYRATDQADRFEAVALDFSIRFGRSTPSWLSIPDQADQALRERTPASLTHTRCDWTTPTHLTQTSLMDLERCLQLALKSSQHLALDWRPLTSVDATQWGRLKTIFQQFSTSPIRCVAYGLKTLEALFDPSSAEATLARLALLRCQNQSQAFEDWALDYCAQFEVSPPDWVKPLCQFETSANLLLERAAESSATGVLAVAAMPELFGVLEDESSYQALTLNNGPVIRCDRLVRCSPIATASLIRWAEAAKKVGPQIEFKDLHRLLAAYFVQQGMGGYAKITIRRD